MTKGNAVIALLTWIFATAGAATFAQSWPEKPIRLVLPYAPGGVPEAIFRTLSTGLEAKLGQRFIVEARPGGDGAIGGGAVARAAPDGYTLVLAGTGLFTVTAHINKNFDFDPLTAFEPISMLADAPMLAVVNPTLPARTLAELIGFLRANPGKFNYGAPNSGSPTHLSGAALSQLTGNSMVYIAYKGVAPMVQALLANDVQVAFPALSGVVSQVKAGKLRVLAVMAKERMPELPDIPTTGEAGYPQLTSTNWWAMAAPRDTPKRIIERLAADVHAVLSEPEVRKRIAGLGHSAVGMSQAETAVFFKAESAHYKEIIERGNLMLQ